MVASQDNKGFTLIELLVVIAIIGILSAIVLAQLNGARFKGADGGIKASLNTVRSQTELFFYDNNNAYAAGTGIVGTVTACPASPGVNTPNNYRNINDPTIFSAISAAVTQSNGTPAANCRFVSTATAWAVAVTLRSGGTAGDSTPDSWCVDSAGRAVSYTWASGETISTSISGTACR